MKSNNIKNEIKLGMCDMCYNNVDELYISTHEDYDEVCFDCKTILDTLDSNIKKREKKIQSRHKVKGVEE